MAANLKLLVPEATTNYVKNPSIRYDTTGWNAVGSVITRVLTFALFGIASLQISTSGLAMGEGAYYRVSDLVGISEPIAASIYVCGTGSVHLRLIEGLGKQWVSPAVALRSDRWTRLEVSGYSTGSDDMRLYVETDGPAKARVFYVTAAQMERKAYSTSYCDGDQPGCRWNIMDSASNASRDPSTRQGGRWIDLAGPCREDDNIYVTVMGGMGMAPLQNNIQSWALSPGSYYQNTKILDRVITFSFNVKSPGLRIGNRPNISKLHELRQQLIDIFKPDVTGGNEPFIMSYQEGAREMFIPVRYEAGLEGSWDVRNSWVNSFPIRLLAIDPMFYENNTVAQQLNFKDESFVSYISARVDGKWNNMAGGLNGFQTAIELGKRGEIIVTGDFTKDYLNTVNLNRITYWDGFKWSSTFLGADGQVRDAAVAPNGDLYVTGAFTHIGVAAINHVARWDGSMWIPLGLGGLEGINGTGYSIAIDPTGRVYVGGIFTTVAGGASLPAKGIAMFDGAWHAIGAGAGVDGDGGGINGQGVFSIDISKDGNSVYFGGQFTKNNGSATNDLGFVAEYDPSTNLITALGAGFDNWVYDIELSPAGVLYAGGLLHTSGTTILNCIGKWNGTQWTPLGAGVSSLAGTFVQTLDINSKEQVIIAGNFSVAGGVPSGGVALWNGSSWNALDIAYNYGGTVPRGLDVRFNGDDIYVGWYTAAPPTNDTLYSAINTVVNHGTAEVKPVIYIYGPGHLRWIENQTNNKRIYLDMTILDNEEVFFDFGKGKVWSSVRGDLTYAILPGSDFADFSLVPGENKLAVFMTDDVNSAMYIYYHPLHWSADSTVNAGALP